MHPDGAVLLVGAFCDLLQVVPELMLSTTSARKHLPSLESAFSVDDWSSLWFPATSTLLLSTLTDEELALPVTCRFRVRTANVHICLTGTDEHLAFLVTSQARPLL